MNILIKTQVLRISRASKIFDGDENFDESNSALDIVIMTPIKMKMRVMNAWND